MSKTDGKAYLTRKRASRSLAAAIKHIEEGLAQLYSAANLRPSRSASPISPELKVKILAAQRRLRLQIFPASLFSDPAWDILIELYVRQLEARRVNISRLTAALMVPATTVLRWLDRLEAEALITREKDIHDARSVWVDLSQYGRSLMDRYFHKLDELMPTD